MKQPFTISANNWIFYAAATALSAIIVYFKESSLDTGYFASIIIYSLILLFAPLFVAVCVWIITMGREKAGQITFNTMLIVVLSLICYVVHVQMPENVQKFFDSLKSAQKLNQLEDEIAETKDLNKFDELLTEYANILANKPPHTLTENEKQTHLILCDYLKDYTQAAFNWKAAVDRAYSYDNFTPEQLSNTKWFSTRIKALNSFIRITKQYRNCIVNAEKELEQRLSVLEYIDESLKQTLEESFTELKNRQPESDRLFKACILFSQTNIKILQLLRSNKSQWKYSKNMYIFNTEKLANKYNALYEELKKQERELFSSRSNLLKKF